MIPEWVLVNYRLDHFSRAEVGHFSGTLKAWIRISLSLAAMLGLSFRFGVVVSGFVSQG
jgi:hypothetical protein